MSNEIESKIVAWFWQHGEGPFRRDEVQVLVDMLSENYTKLDVGRALINMCDSNRDKSLYWIKVGVDYDDYDIHNIWWQA